MQYDKKYPLLTAIEERNLITKAQNGDKSSFDYLIMCNMGLVTVTAKKFRDKGMDFDDLFQVGIMGLMVAIQKFDLSKELKLSTYSYIWIRQRMIRLIQNDSRTIRIPCHTFERNFNLIVDNKKLEQELERAATNQELADYSKQSLKNVENFKKDMIEMYSLNKLTDNNEIGTEVIEFVHDVNSVDIVTRIAGEMVGEELTKLIRSILNEKEFNIFSQKVGLSYDAKSFKDLATDFDLTSKKVTAIYRNVVNKLKNNRRICEYRVS